MIEILGQSTENCLVVHFGGKVSGSEYQEFLDALDERMRTGARISLVLELAGLEGYGDFAAAKMDFKFGVGEYRHIHRAAFVGDQKWIDWFTRLIGLFTKAEEKHFPEGQLEAACDWARV
jgi:SpoIIAA-like